jgi:hypothetical protein
MLERLLEILRRRLAATGSPNPHATRPKAPHWSPPLPAPKTRRWHAVSVEPGHNACRAAHAIEGVRFLAAEAPKLPLADCDAKQCTCHYRHFDDRRDPRPLDIEPKDLLSRPFRRSTD